MLEMAVLCVFLEVGSEFLSIVNINFVFILQKMDQYCIKISELITTNKFNV
jgi:hypothetical protein